MNTPRFALLQARSPNDIAKHEEHQAFADRLAVPIEDVCAVDIFSVDLTSSILEPFDALLVGGAGEYSVLDDNTHIKRFIDFLGQCANDGFPLFASCFGFQALVLALGGDVIADEPNAEVGSYVLHPTQQAKEDPVFSTLPDPFVAQLGHKDRASRLPDCVENLAASQRCPFQAIRMTDRPVYATQFHPELTWKDNRLRFQRYMPIYGKLFGEEKALERLNSHRPGPEANTLLRRFAVHVVGLGEHA